MGLSVLSDFSLTGCSYTLILNDWGPIYSLLALCVQLKTTNRFVFSSQHRFWTCIQWWANRFWMWQYHKHHSQPQFLPLQLPSLWPLLRSLLLWPQPPSQLQVTGVTQRHLRTGLHATCTTSFYCRCLNVLVCVFMCGQVGSSSDEFFIEMLYN